MNVKSQMQCLLGLGDISTKPQLHTGEFSEQRKTHALTRGHSVRHPGGRHGAGGTRRTSLQARQLRRFTSAQVRHNKCTSIQARQL